MLPKLFLPPGYYAVRLKESMPHGGASIFPHLNQKKARRGQPRRRRRVCLFGWKAVFLRLGYYRLAVHVEDGLLYLLCVENSDGGLPAAADQFNAVDILSLPPFSLSCLTSFGRSPSGIFGLKSVD
jgi:hypothetical protein